VGCKPSTSHNAPLLLLPLPLFAPFSNKESFKQRTVISTEAAHGLIVSSAAEKSASAFALVFCL
jgi:hypothetical protein